MTTKQRRKLNEAIDHLAHCLDLARIGAGGNHPERGLAYVEGGIRDVKRLLAQVRGESQRPA